MDFEYIFSLIADFGPITIAIFVALLFAYGAWQGNRHIKNERRERFKLLAAEQAYSFEAQSSHLKDWHAFTLLSHTPIHNLVYSRRRNIPFYLFDIRPKIRIRNRHVASSPFITVVVLTVPYPNFPLFRLRGDKHFSSFMDSGLLEYVALNVKSGELNEIYDLKSPKLFFKTLDDLPQGFRAYLKDKTKEIIMIESIGSHLLFFRLEQFISPTAGAVNQFIDEAINVLELIESG